MNTSHIGRFVVLGVSGITATQTGFLDARMNFSCALRVTANRQGQLRHLVCGTVSPARSSCGILGRGLGVATLYGLSWSFVDTPFFILASTKEKERSPIERRQCALGIGRSGIRRPSSNDIPMATWLRLNSFHVPAQTEKNKYFWRDIRGIALSYS